MQSKGWALILGASSGFGAACSRELARDGYDVFGVHLDRRATLGNVAAITADVEAAGRRAVFFNANAADPAKRAEIVAAIGERLAADGKPGSLRVLLHSLAFGTLRPFVRDSLDAGTEALNQAQMEMTLDVMANSLVYWTRDLVWKGHLSRGGRIFAMTSAGSTHVVPNYGAVSAAKAALESHVRQLAYELAPLGIAANAIRAGATDTPAMRKIPGHEEIIARAVAKNPSGRMTVPEDVARALVALCDERLYWVTGNVIGVDGGEEVAG
jgi:NAD(P)-dependent dehydrogenase (short-subunit alcohol dehydrogenase family)